MTLHEPIALENAAATDRPNAEEFRLMMRDLARSNIDAVLNLGQIDSTVGGYVLGVGHLAVTAGSGTNVAIAAGRAFVDATFDTTPGVYWAWNDASVETAITASDPTNPRIDYVVLRIRDDAEDAGGNNDAIVDTIDGIPASSPVAPDLSAEDNILPLATIQVPALALSSGEYTITDLTQRCDVIARGVIAEASRTTNANNITTVVDLAALTVTFTAVANRRYQIVGDGHFEEITGASQVTMQVTDGLDAVIRECRQQISGTNDHNLKTVAFHQPGAGEITYKLRALASGSGVNMINTPNAPALLTVSDIGPAFT